MTPDEIEAENRKYHAPSIRLVQLSSGMWAIYDHYYQLLKIVPMEQLLGNILSVPRVIRPEPDHNKTHLKETLLNIELDL